MKTREIPKLSPNDIRRFREKVKKIPNGCWLWIAARMPYGYGQFTICREKKQQFTAHRLSYTIYKGKIPPGMVIRHLCDNPSCVNPAHLATGSQSDNYNDSFLRGKTAGQVNNKLLKTRSKLTEKQVREIRRRKEPQRACAKIYNVSPSAVAAIRCGRSWKDVL